MKSILSSVKLIKPWYNRQPLMYGFSKRLKIKIQNEAKNDPVPADPPINRVSPYIGNLTQAERRNMNFFTQFAPPFLMLMNCFVTSDILLNNLLYDYSLFGVEKLVSFLVLTNIGYPPNQYVKYGIIGFVIATNFIPIYSYYSFVTQIFQLLVVLSNEKKIPETTSLTDEQRKILVGRLQVKLALYFLLVSICMFKGLFHYRCQQMKDTIKTLNKINRGQVVVDPKEQQKLATIS